jgi:predicted ATPase/class 3 adenylate cyclase
MRAAWNDMQTFLFTDIEGSTRRWSRTPEAMADAVQRQEDLLRRTIAGGGGRVFKSVGDGIFAVFGSPVDAVRTAVAAQRALLAEGWDGFADDDSIQVRIGVHTGEAESRDGDYFGPTLNRLSRLLHAGHGGQILVTGETVSACGEHWPQEIGTRDLGERTLRDVSGSGRIYQLVAEGLPEQFPPLETLDPRVHNLPRWPSAMVDREADAGRLRTALRSSETRMVTVLGTGGVGKTRLTTEVAAQLLDEFQDGIRFVDLSALREDVQVLPAIVQVTSANDPLLPAKDAVLEWLRSRELLLVLDNCEQVVDGVAEICSEIAHTAPGVTILATSRAPIRIRGERQLALEPLPLPGDEPDLINDNSAVALFAERAREVNESFALDAESASEIAEICRIVDGLPLAIELAAAWVRILSPAALQRRLQEGRGILRDGARDLPDRQRTLTNTIAWSYDLLEPEDQRAFRRLAVFRGGIAVDAAAAVIWDTPITDPLWALSRLDALVQANLLQATPDPTGEPRFHMLQMIQEFAIEVLRDSGEWDEVAAAHADYFGALAAEARDHSRTDDAAQWFTRIGLDFANLRAAVEYHSATPETNEAGLRLVVALADYLDHRQAREWFELIYRDDADYPPSLRVDALFHMGNTWHSDPTVAGDLYRQAIDIATASGDMALRVRPMASLSTVAVLSGDYEIALTLAREVLEFGKRESNFTYTAQGYYRLAYISCEAGLFDQALAACQQARSFFEEVGDADFQAWGWVVEGRTHRRLRNPEAAVNALENAAMRFEEIGDDESVGLCRLEQGLALLDSDARRARQLLDTATRLLADTTDAYTIIAALEGIGKLFILERQPELGSEFVGTAIRLREQTGISAPRSETGSLLGATNSAVTSIGSAEFERRVGLGRNRSPRAAIELYLSSTVS